MIKKTISTLVKLLVTVGLFVLLFWPETFGLPPDTFGGVKPHTLLDEFRSLHLQHALPWLLFALCIRLSGIMCGVIRWKILLNGQNLYMPFFYMTQSWFIGRTIGIFLPSTIGLDGYRLYDSIRYTGDPLRCTTVIFIEKIIGFISLTTLVFLTFPLGFRLLKFNIYVLIGILFILGMAVAFFLLLLLQPFIIQFILNIIPTPKKIKNLLTRIGESATAYAGHRKHLVLAILCGLAVHLSACFMYFGTMMALKTENTTLWDVLFASPLMIYGTVLGPSIGGEGIREIVFATLLGGKENTLKVVAFAHLGWWVGDVVPFLIGLPFLVFRKRPTKEEIERQIQQVQASTAKNVSEPKKPKEKIHSPSSDSPLQVKQFFVGILFSGLGAVTAGSIAGFVESLWIHHIIPVVTDYQNLYWGPIVYGGLAFGPGIFLGIIMLIWFYLLFRTTPHPILSYISSFALNALIIGSILISWRFMRDITGQNLAKPIAVLPIFLYFLGSILLFPSLLYIVLKFTYNKSKVLSTILLVILLSILPLGGFVYEQIMPPTPTEPQHVQIPTTTKKLPNIIFIIADALRADHLTIYNDSAKANIPNLTSFAEKSILFEDCSSQASWTKPAVATLFTGVIPSRHKATLKNSAIDSELTTIAELLTQQGYYTKAFTNNPNVQTIFGFHKGFVEFTNLPLSRTLFAKDSSTKLTIYEILRRIHAHLSTTLSKYLHLPPNIQAFYQPAEIVTQKAIEWLDSKKYASHPFFLYLHYMDTHDPFYNRDTNRMYARALLGTNPKRNLTPLMQEAYVKEIEYLDKHLGILLDYLERKGITKDTYIIFMADHGEEFEDHNGWWHGYTLYEEMLHVPLIIKVPEEISNPNNTQVIVPEMVRSIDVPSTILQIADIEIPPQFQGKPFLTKEGILNIQNEPIAFAENDYEGQFLKSIRKLNLKLITANPDNPRKLEPEELYDLDADPLEKNNLASHPEMNTIKQDLLLTMQNIIQQSSIYDSDSNGYSIQTTPLPSDIQEQLKSLGYFD